MRWAAALLALAAPALAENSVVLEGYQFRLLWPATGALSPDLIAEQAGDGANSHEGSGSRSIHQSGRGLGGR